MAENAYNRSQSDVTSFFDRIKGQDRVRKSDSLIVLNTPQSDRERKVKQKISSIVQFVKNKTWSRRHVEFFEEYRRMVATFPIIKAGIDIYSEEMCWSADTIIPMLSGEDKTIGELYEGEVRNFWVYGINPETKEILPVQCEKVILKGEKQIVEIRLDDGTVLKCTEDHRLLLKTGEWKEAKSIVSGDSLQSLYTRLDRNGYLEISNGEQVKTSKRLSWKKVHSLVGNSVLREQKDLLVERKYERSIDNMKVIHHKSFNKLNNDPQQLEWMLWKDHKDFHNSLNSERWSNPGFGDKIRKTSSENLISLWNRPGYREWKSKVKEQGGTLRHLNGFGKFVKQCGYSNIQEVYMAGNHRVVSVIKTNSTEKVYDIVNAGKHHNFAVKCNDGMIISHNCAVNSDGKVFTIKCENKHVKELLEECFFKNLALNSKSFKIGRMLCQFGNAYAYLITRPKDGVTDLVFLPPEAIIREQMYDPSNLENYRFTWYGAGGGSVFEPWEIVHWKNGEDIEMEPYGSSILRPVVDTWRRVVLIREALVIYRITRAPSKLLFKIGTDGLTGEEAMRFAQEMKKEVTKKPLVNPQTGEIDFKYNPMPIAGYTPIPLLDGRCLTIKEVAEEYEQGKENYVYSIQDKTHQVVAGKIKWCGKNYTANKLIRVWLDNDSYIDAAPEHPFIKRDGSKVKAEDLKSGDSLMPFYQDKKELWKGKSLDYHRTYNPATGKFEFTHRLVAKELEKEYQTANTIHHINVESLENRFNNNPTNLRWMTAKDHRELHNSIVREMWSGPNNLHHREVASKNLTAYNKSLEGRAKVSRCNKERESYKAMMDYKRSPEGREAQRLLAYEMITKRDLPESTWKKNMSIHFSDLIIDSLRQEIILGKIITKHDAVKYINTNLKEELEKINTHSRRELKVTPSLLRYRLMELGYKSFNEFRYRTLNMSEEDKKRDYSERCSNTAKQRHIDNPELRKLIGDTNKKYGKVKLMTAAKLARKLEKEQQVEQSEPSQYLNHKVDRIEVLENVSEDVYCMTVVGLSGEDDRHNFACLSRNGFGITTSGSIVSNSVEENLFIPVYEGSPSDVSVLEGAGNLDAVEDYKIIKDDLFAGLKIPKSFLTFEEDLSNKAALSEEDCRFAKTIQRLQSEYVEGLLHIGIVHLFLKGCSQEEMESFTIEMNNPSIASEKKKLELLQARLDIAKSAWDYNNSGLNLMSYSDVLKSILKFTDAEIEATIKSQFNEKKIAWRLEQIRTNGEYSEPEIEKKIAAMRGLTGKPDGKTPTGFDDLTFEGGTITEILKGKIDKEIQEIIQPVTAKASPKLIRQLTEGTEKGSELVRNLKKSRKDFGMK